MNIQTQLESDHEKGAKIISTTTWGKFKVRKNGKVVLKVEDEIVRCTPIREVKESI